VLSGIAWAIERHQTCGAGSAEFSGVSAGGRLNFEIQKGFQMAKNIYVGNLVWEVTADDLLALFQEHGSVARAQVITDRETGRSRGFGFVEMENDAEAQKAIDALNGQDFRGRSLTVNEARPREERGGGNHGEGGYGGGRGGYGGNRGGGRRY
jgi:RNA recognition motif-containing protein